jgi:hypothetical protein
LWLWRKNRTVFVASIISFVLGTTALFVYFFPTSPSRAFAYFVYFALGHVVFWFRLPRLADPVSWIRMLLGFLKGLRKKT